MSMYAVIDTNVLVSALITSNSQSPTRLIYQSIDAGLLIPVFNDEILSEYRLVLSREKFHLPKSLIDELISKICIKGITTERFAYNAPMLDEKDRVFYEVSLSIDGSYLVTGNLKHYPITPRVVTPTEMVAILNA